MSTFAGIFAAAFITGLSGAVLPGPLLAFTITSAAKRGASAGLLVVVGHAIFESTLVVLIFVGAANFLKSPLLLRTLGGAGAAVLALLGILMLAEARKASLSAALEGALDGGAARKARHPVVGGLLLTALNPTFPVWWAGLGFAMVTKYGTTIPNVAVFYAGHISSDLVWYAAIGLAAGHGRRFVSDRAYRAFVAVCAVFLIALAAWFAWGAVRGNRLPAGLKRLALTAAQRRVEFASVVHQSGLRINQRLRARDGLTMREELKMKGLLPGITREIVDSYDHTREINHLEGSALPDREKVIEIIQTMMGILYPGYFGRKGIDRTTAEFHIGTEVESAHRLLFDQVTRSIEHECKRLGRTCTFCEDRAEEVAIAFISRVPVMREILALDVQAAYDGDPAAKSLDEIIFSYPGIFAITVFRMAHELHRLGVPLIPRIMTEYAHTRTGIDIHPGATIGRSFFIDHGTGVVIGETCVIGNNVKLYQGVTLGAHSFAKDDKGRLVRGTKRHPTLEDNVTIYSGATILGGDTVIGAGSTVGGNVWLTHSVPPGTMVIFEKPVQKVRTPRKGKRPAR